MFLPESCCAMAAAAKRFIATTWVASACLRPKEIVTRKELKTSVMPEGLIDLLTDREIRDLLAFLDHHAEPPTLVSTDQAVDPFLGQWWLDFDDGYGGWLSVERVDDGSLSAKLLWRVGSPRPVNGVAAQAGELHFANRGKRAGQYVARVDGDEITVTQVVDGKDSCGPRPAVTAAAAAARFGHHQIRSGD